MSSNSKNVVNYTNYLKEIIKSIYENSLNIGEACANTLLYAESLFGCDLGAAHMFTTNLIQSLCKILRQMLLVKNTLTKNVVTSSPENLIHLAPFIEMNNEIYTRAESRRRNRRNRRYKKLADESKDKIKTECEVIVIENDDDDKLKVSTLSTGVTSGTNSIMTGPYERATRPSNSKQPIRKEKVKVEHNVIVIDDDLDDDRNKLKLDDHHKKGSCVPKRQVDNFNKGKSSIEMDKVAGWLAEPDKSTGRKQVRKTQTSREVETECNATVNKNSEKSKSKPRQTDHQKRDHGITKYPFAEQNKQKYVGAVRKTHSHEPRPNLQHETIRENVTIKLKSRDLKATNVVALDNNGAEKVTTRHPLKTHTQDLIFQVTQTHNTTEECTFDAEDVEKDIRGCKNASRPHETIANVDNAAQSTTTSKEIKILSSYRVINQPTCPPKVVLEPVDFNYAKVFSSNTIEVPASKSSSTTSNVVENSEKSLCMFEAKKRENWNTSSKGTDEPHSGRTQDSALDKASAFGDGLLVVTKMLPVRNYTKKPRRKRGRKKVAVPECETSTSTVPQKKAGRKKKDTNSTSKAEEKSNGALNQVEGRYGRVIHKPKRYGSCIGDERSHGKRNSKDTEENCISLSS